MGPHCQDHSYPRGRADLAGRVADRGCQEAGFGTANSPSATTARATVPAHAGVTRARGRWAVLGLPRHSRPGWRKLLAVAGRRGEHRSILPDQGCYEERYRLTGQAAAGLAIGLISVGLGVLWQPPISAAAVVLAIPVIFSAIAVLLAMPGLIAMARRKTAFRADYAGITLGTLPDNLALLRGSPVFIPWADVEQIILYPSGPSETDAPARIQYIAVQRREEAAPPPPDGATPAPGRATPAAHKITGWRLDRERFAAVAAAVAPGVPIVEASTGPRPGAPNGPA